MKLKKVLCCFLAAAMTLSMVACGGNAGGSSADSDSGSKQETPVEDAGTEDAGEAKTADGLADDPLAELPDLEDVYAGAVVAGTPEMYSNVDLSSPCNINVYMVCDKPNDWDMVVEAINEYLTPFNTTMSATFISLADYQKLYPLALQGDDCDIIYTSGWCYLASEATKGSFHEFTEDFIRDYMPLVTKYQRPESYEDVKVGGRVYSLNQNIMDTTTKFVAIRQDLADKYDIGELKNWADFKNFMLTIAQKETPESGIYANAASADNKEFWEIYAQQYTIRDVVESDLLRIGYEFDGSSIPTFDQIKLEYQTDIFREFCYDMKEMADAGCWSRGALTSTNSDEEAFGNLQGASVAWNSSLFTYVETAEKTEGVVCAAYDLSPDKMTMAKYGKGSMAIAEGSRNQERAAMILDLMKNDTYFNKLITFGIEGVHYEMLDETHYRILDKAEDYPAYGVAASWSVKNVRYTEEGQDPRKEAMSDSIFERAVASPTVAFSFDDTQISDYTAAIKSVVNDYVPMLQLGLVDDVDATLEEMNQKLDASGLQIYMDELETQYNAWLAEQ